jgi:hypothetical protein
MNSYSLHYFAAELLKIDLVSKASSYLKRRSSASSRSAITFDVWCRFTCRLLDNKFETLRMPGSYNANSETIGKMMSEAVGNRCPGLKLFKSSISLNNYSDEVGYSKWLEPIFFRALPRLANLQVVQLKFFICDHKALEQFAIHTKKLV